MAKVDVEADFPSLKNRDYDLSDEDFNYNCLAFALGDQNQWWEPPRGLGAYWPEGFPEDTISTDRGIDHPSSWVHCRYRTDRRSRCPRNCNLCPRRRVDPLRKVRGWRVVKQAGRRE